MTLDDNEIRNIKLLILAKKFAEKDVEQKFNDFFTNHFKNFSDSDKARIISLFIKYLDKQRTYHETKEEDYKDIIKESFKKAINSFYSSLDPNESNLYFDLITLYMHFHDDEIDTDTLNKIMIKINDMLNKNTINDNNKLTELLIAYIKYYIYQYNGDEKKAKIITDSQHFNIFEKIIIKYLEKIEINSTSINDELLLLLMESRNLPRFDNINKLLINKGNSNALNKYYDNIKNKIPIAKEELTKFYEDIIAYRLSKGILPREICNYLFMFNLLSRIGVIDLVQNYLIENNINDITCFFDPLSGIHGGAVANTKYISFKSCYYDNITMFHEATHTIQYNNMDNNRNYTRYNYNILKDFLIQDNIPYNCYLGNHQKFLFEIDADTQGKYQLGLLQLSLTNSKEKFYKTQNEMKKISEEEQKLISESENLIINGEQVNKKELFDKIILSKPFYVKTYPVLSIEYNEDGSKKNTDEILRTIEYCQQNNLYSQEELTAISNCIFGNEIEKKM